MAKLSIRKIDTEIAKAKRDGREIRLWDDEPKGMGLRIKPSGTATFFVQFRSPETFKKVRHTIDQYGKVTLDQARKKAKSLLGEIADGADPNLAKKEARRIASESITLSNLCDDYLQDAKDGIVTYRGKPKKASTIAVDEGRIERHIKPTLGDKLTKDITKAEVERAMHDIRLGKTAVDEKTDNARGRARVTGGPGTASRTIQLLGAIFSYAIKHGVRPDNPVSGIERPPPGKRNRSLSPEEYEALGKSLDELHGQAGVNELPLYALRILALTGCRKGEIVGLKKIEIDDRSGCFRFEDTKTGQQNRPVGRAALDILRQVPGKNSDYVFPARPPKSKEKRGHRDQQIENHLDGKKAFGEIFKKANLEGVTAHILRHSYASVAHELGYSELMIAGLLGHSIGSVTGRYTHHVDHALVTAADRVSSVIDARMKGNKAEGAEVININRGAHG